MALARFVFETRNATRRRQRCAREDRPALTGAESSVRVLVTGGAGFMGSHLTEALLAMGHEVVVLDDLSTGRAENLQAVQDHPRLEVVMGSVTDEAVVRKLMLGVDVVFHLAAAVGVAGHRPARVDHRDQHRRDRAVLQAPSPPGARW